MFIFVVAGGPLIDPNNTPLINPVWPVDITDCLAHRGVSVQDRPAVESVVAEIRGRIFQETQLTASAGIACNAMLAKIASDMNKPNGQYFLPPDRDSCVSFVRTLNVRKVGELTGPW